MVPEPVVVKLEPVPTNIAAEVFVEPVKALNAVLAVLVLAKVIPSPDVVSVTLAPGMRLRAPEDGVTATPLF
jgi:hypothetical protein